MTDDSATCPECGKVPTRWTRTLCHPCYMQHWKNGTHLAVPARPVVPVGDSKACTKCHVVKPLGDYAAMQGRRDGRASYCKQCHREHYYRPKAAHNRSVAPHFEGTITCRLCCVEKPAIEYYWERDKARHSSECKACKSVLDKNRHDANPTRRRTSVLMRKFGLTDNDYAEMLANQAGGCAICGSPTNPDQPAGHLAVDHCHTTGRIRGLLCGPCNKAIGLLRDDPDLLRKAVTYFEGR